MKNQQNKCKHCQSDITPMMKKCPQCGGDLRPWARRHPVLTILFVLFLIGLLPSLFGGSDKPKNSNVTKNNVAKNVEYIDISAVQLSREYNENKVSADIKYKDKGVRMNGIVNDIGKDILEDPYVTLKGIEMSLFGIQCMFSHSDENKLAGLSKGQSIILKGIVSGEMIGNVLVRGCKIEE